MAGKKNVGALVQAGAFTDAEVKAKVESLIAQIKVDNDGCLDKLPFGEEFLPFALELLVRSGTKDEKIIELFERCDWDSIVKAKDGKPFYEMYKGYRHLFIFELCKNNCYHSLGRLHYRGESRYIGGGNLIENIAMAARAIFGNELEALEKEIHRKTWFPDKCVAEKPADEHQDIPLAFDKDNVRAEILRLLAMSRESAKKILSKRDDLVDAIGDAENGLSDKSDDKPIRLGTQLEFLHYIGTNKARNKAWEIFRKSTNDPQWTRYDIVEGIDVHGKPFSRRDVKVTIYEMAEIIKEQGEHFPLKFVKDADVAQDKGSIMSICKSENMFSKSFFFTHHFDKSDKPEFDKGDIDLMGLHSLSNHFDLLIKLLLAPKDYWDDHEKESTPHDRAALGLPDDWPMIGDDPKKDRIPYGCDMVDDIIQLMDRNKKFAENAERALGDNIRNVRFFPRGDIYSKDEAAFNNNRSLYLLLHEGKELDEESINGVIREDFVRIMLMKPFFWSNMSSKSFELFYDNCHKHLVHDPNIIVRIANCFLEEANSFYQEHEYIYRSRININDNICLPLVPECAEYLLSRADDMFSTALKNFMYNSYIAFLTASRKRQISILLKKGALQQAGADQLIEMAEGRETNYYAWSDGEILQELSKAHGVQEARSIDFDDLHANLEPEFMVRVFEKSILWVIEHKDSYLWLDAPWFGMQIFNKSYADRPSIWAKHLIKIAGDWQGSESMLFRICFALGHLREPLGGEVPVVLQKIADRQESKYAKDLISTQRNLFNRENFNKGHHRTPSKRVELCKKELVKGQNKEVESMISARV